MDSQTPAPDIIPTLDPQIQALTHSIHQNKSKILCLEIQLLQNESVIAKLKSEQRGLIRSYQKSKYKQYQNEIGVAIQLSLQNPNTESSEPTYEELLHLEEQIGNVSVGFTDQEISKIPVKKLENNENCSVCLSSVCEGKMLVCQHSFHSECIDQWLRCKRNCPLCLHEVSLLDF